MLPQQRNLCTDCKSAQVSLYHSPKLHPGTCSRVGMQRGTDRHMHKHTDGHHHNTFRLATPNAKCNNCKHLTCPCSSNAMITTAAPYRRISLAFAMKSASPSFRLILLTMHLPGCIGVLPRSRQSWMSRYIEEPASAMYMQRAHSDNSGSSSSSSSKQEQLLVLHHVTYIDLQNMLCISFIYTGQHT